MEAEMNVDQPMAIITEEDEYDYALRMDGDAFQKRAERREEALAAGEKVTTEDEYRRNIWLPSKEVKADAARKRVQNLRNNGMDAEVSERDLELITDSDRRRQAYRNACANCHSDLSSSNASTYTPMEITTADSKNSEPPQTPNTSAKMKTASTPFKDLSFNQITSKAKEARNRINTWKKLGDEDSIDPQDLRIVAEYERMKQAEEVMSASAMTGVTSTSKPTCKPASPITKAFSSDKGDIESSRSRVATSKNLMSPPTPNKGYIRSFQPQPSSFASAASAQDTHNASSSECRGHGHLQHENTLQTAHASHSDTNNNGETNEGISGQGKFLEGIAKENAGSGIPGPFGTSLANIKPAQPIKNGLFGSSTSVPERKPAKFTIQQFSPNAFPYPFSRKPSGPILGPSTSIISDTQGPIVANQQSNTIAGSQIPSAQGAIASSLLTFNPAQSSGPSVVGPVPAPEMEGLFSLPTFPQRQPVTSSNAPLNVSHGNTILTSAPANLPQTNEPSIVPRPPTTNGVIPFSLAMVTMAQESTLSIGTPDAGAPASDPSSAGTSSSVAIAPPLSSHSGIYSRPISPGKNRRRNRFGAGSQGQAFLCQTNRFETPQIVNPTNQAPQFMSFFSNALQPDSTGRVPQFAQGFNNAATSGQFANSNILPNSSQGSEPITLGQGTNVITPSITAGAFQEPTSSTSTSHPHSQIQSFFQPSISENPVPNGDTAMGDAPEPRQAVSTLPHVIPIPFIMPENPNPFQPTVIPAVSTIYGFFNQQAPDVLILQSGDTSMEGTEDMDTGYPGAAPTKQIAETCTDSAMTDVPTSVVQNNSSTEQNEVAESDAVMVEASVKAAVTMAEISPQPMQSFTPKHQAIVEAEVEAPSQQDETASQEDAVILESAPEADDTLIQNGGHLDPGEVAADRAVLETSEQQSSAAEEPPCVASQCTMEPASPDADQMMGLSQTTEEVLPALSVSSVSPVEPLEAIVVAAEKQKLPALVPQEDSAELEKPEASGSGTQVAMFERELGLGTSLLVRQNKDLQSSKKDLERQIQSLQQQVRCRDKEIRKANGLVRAKQRDLELEKKSTAKRQDEVASLDYFKGVWKDRCIAAEKELEAEKKTRVTLVAEAEDAYAKSRESVEQDLKDDIESLRIQIEDLVSENSRMLYGQREEEKEAAALNKRLGELGKYQYQSKAMSMALSLQRGFARADYMFAVEANDSVAAAIALGQLQVLDTLSASFNQTREYDQISGVFLPTPPPLVESTSIDPYIMETGGERMMDGSDDNTTCLHLQSKKTLYLRNITPIGRWLAINIPCKTKPCRDSACNHGVPPTLKAVLAQEAKAVEASRRKTLPPNPVSAKILSTNTPSPSFPQLPATLALTPAISSALVQAVSSSTAAVAPPTPVAPILAPVVLVPASVVSIAPQTTIGYASPSMTATLPTIFQAQTEKRHKLSFPKWICWCLIMLASLFATAGVLMALQSFGLNSIAPITAQDNLVSLNNSCPYVPLTLTAVSCGLESPTPVITTPLPIETMTPPTTQNEISEPSDEEPMSYTAEEIFEDGPYGVGMFDDFSWEIPTHIIAFTTVFVLPAYFIKWALDAMFGI